MPNIIEITDLSAPELDIYARLTDIANGGELGPVYTHLGQRG